MKVILISLHVAWCPNCFGTGVVFRTLFENRNTLLSFYSYIFAATAITIKGRGKLQNDTLVGLFKLKSIKSTGHVLRAFFSLLGTSLVSSLRCPQAYCEHNCSYLQARHEDSCDFMIILCPSCKELMRANEQERHNERECPERTLNCKYCKDPFQLKNIKVSLFFVC